MDVGSEADFYLLLFRRIFLLIVLKMLSFLSCSSSFSVVLSFSVRAAFLFLSFEIFSFRAESFSL